MSEILIKTVVWCENISRMELSYRQSDISHYNISVILKEVVLEAKARTVKISYYI